VSWGSFGLHLRLSAKTVGGKRAVTAEDIQVADSLSSRTFFRSVTHPERAILSTTRIAELDIASGKVIARCNLTSANIFNLSLQIDFRSDFRATWLS
jgi:pyruvate/2-oxoglutarate dehydrogenase complex dihydrolipoamide acyltransferase (E2) component